MKHITIRNISSEMLKKLELLSKLENRSINNEILFILQKEVSKELKKKITKEKQLKIWEEISGKWEDTRKTSEIIEDIISKRSLGREVNL